MVKESSEKILSGIDTEIAKLEKQKDELDGHIEVLKTSRDMIAKRLDGASTQSPKTKKEKAKSVKPDKKNKSKKPKDSKKKFITCLFQKRSLLHTRN